MPSNSNSLNRMIRRILKGGVGEEEEEKLQPPTNASVAQITAPVIIEPVTPANNSNVTASSEAASSEAASEAASSEVASSEAASSEVASSEAASSAVVSDVLNTDKSTEQKLDADKKVFIEEIDALKKTYNDPEMTNIIDKLLGADEELHNIFKEIITAYKDVQLNESLIKLNISLFALQKKLIKQDCSSLIAIIKDLRKQKEDLIAM
jgi:cobalamin biosynthesis Mg chelatase CobN